MDTTIDYRRLFQRNAKRIAELHDRMHEACEKGNTQKHGRELWIKACTEFWDQYDDLAFPGGYRQALDRLKNNESETTEAAITFLEIRPYFFRSGYMRETLMRRLKHVKMKDSHARRFEAVREAERRWRASKTTGCKNIKSEQLL